MHVGVQRELGKKTGENLWLMAHGRDLRVVQTPKPRKSLGAEVNWGIRFRNQQDADVFLLKLSGEVWSARLSEPLMLFGLHIVFQRLVKTDCLSSARARTV
jgi:nucleotidyltransferase/DNA polymerase involved in DNA repair